MIEVDGLHETDFFIRRSIHRRIMIHGCDQLESDAMTSTILQTSCTEFSRIELTKSWHRFAYERTS
jgi:hypothetical protein